MKHPVLLLSLLALLTFGSARGQECGTPDLTQQAFEALPWYGDTLLLDQFYDSLTNVPPVG